MKKNKLVPKPKMTWTVICYVVIAILVLFAMLHSKIVPEKLNLGLWPVGIIILIGFYVGEYIIPHLSKIRRIRREFHDDCGDIGESFKRLNEFYEKYAKLGHSNKNNKVKHISGWILNFMEIRENMSEPKTIQEKVCACSIGYTESFPGVLKQDIEKCADSKAWEELIPVYEYLLDEVKEVIDDKILDSTHRALFKYYYLHPEDSLGELIARIEDSKSVLLKALNHLKKSGDDFEDFDNFLSNVVKNLSNNFPRANLEVAYSKSPRSKLENALLLKIGELIRAGKE